jgi:WD40 repeat protein
VAFSPDGLTLASGSFDNTIKLWDTTTGTHRQTLEGHSGLVYSVAFSPDGLTLASGSHDNTIKLWDITTGTHRQTLAGHSGPVYSVAFSPDGLTLSSGSHDHTIKLWDITTGTHRQTLAGHSESVHAVLNEPKSNFQVSLSNAWITLGGENLLWLPSEYRGFVCHAAKNATLALGYRDGRVFIIEFHKLYST